MIKYKKQTAEFIFEEDKFFPQCHASTLALLDSKKKKIGAAWFAGSYEKHVDTAIWYSVRENEVWSDPVKIADWDAEPCWNPVLFYDDGRLILHYKAGPDCADWWTMVCYSTDDGKTWTEPQELVKGDIGGRGPVKNKLIVLSDGTWAAPSSNEQNGSWDSFVDLSYDKGKTWEKSNVIALTQELSSARHGIIQPTLWESKKGYVHMFMRSTNEKIYRSDSNDYGRTWSEPYKTEIPNNNSGIDLVQMDDGQLVLCYNPVGIVRGPRTPVSLSVSNDSGETWSDPHNLEYTIKGEYSYPAIIADGDKIYLTYTWNRKTIAFWEIDITDEGK